MFSQLIPDRGGGISKVYSAEGVYQNNILPMGNDGKPNTIIYLVPLSQSDSENFA